jgi:hypothetical protein
MKHVSTAQRCRMVVVAAAVAAASAVVAGAGTGKFYPDDPLPIDPEPEEARGVAPHELNHALDGWDSVRGAGDRTCRRALNVNSMDEVPDSSWFTNRIGSILLSIGEIVRGPDRDAGPVPGQWTVIAGKTDGVTPGFQLKDAAGQRYFVKFDPPGNPEMASGAEVLSTKLLHAAGYHVPENHIATLRREHLIIGEGAMLKTADGQKRLLTSSDLDQILQLAARRPDGSYRIMASRALEGAPVGPFRYDGTRPDDPNDIVPHEHRRELRGLRVFAAWLNHVDSKGENSLDTLVKRAGRTIVWHHLLDFGSTLGSAGVSPMDWRSGYEYAFDKRATVLALVSFGFYLPPWQRIHYPDLPSVGRIDGDHFRPEQWKPTLPNPAFRNARPDDTFWAAVRVMAFSDEAIKAAVGAAQLSDPRASAYLTDVLIKRRDQIGRTWLTAVNPVVHPVVDGSGLLTFRNAATDAGLAAPPSEYQVTWSTFDNATGVAAPIGIVQRCPEERCSLPANGAVDARYLMAEIRTIQPAFPAWSAPVRVFLRRGGDAWTAMALERMPDSCRGSSRARQSAAGNQSRAGQ